MHITAEDIFVEVVDGGGLQLQEGEAGEIVITLLATKDFPFIRYRTGDIGVLDSKLCSCGRGLPILKEIQGRSTDFLVARDGKVMHGLALIYILRDLPWVCKFKIIQENLDLTRVLIVANTRMELQDAEDIKAAFRSRLGQAVSIVVEQVEEIPPEKSGKFRYVVSKVAAY
jgi:phenylacetate-CoA ligase